MTNIRRETIKKDYFSSAKVIFLLVSSIAKHVLLVFFPNEFKSRLFQTFIESFNIWGE